MNLGYLLIGLVLLFLALILNDLLQLFNSNKKVIKKEAERCKKNFSDINYHTRRNKTRGTKLTISEKTGKVNIEAESRLTIDSYI